MSSEEILKKWVKQPPTTPLVQYLRDAEKISAWRFIRGRKKILDIASESNVTLGINAKHITRVDASLEAGNLAKEILGKIVNNFVVIDPSNPILPFPKNNFNAAVSIGPYDWLFLDVEKLTKEVYRVVVDEGLFVFSVPTFKTPYYEPQNERKFRYYTIDKLMSLINNSDWNLKDFMLLYQPPKIFYSMSSIAPSNLQKPLIKLCWWMTRYYTHRELWSKASFIVVVLEKREGGHNENI
jgi:SAM-dependent methyltransferase